MRRPLSLLGWFHIVIICPQFTLGHNGLHGIVHPFRRVAVPFEQMLYHHTHLGSRRITLLPIYSTVLSQCICQFFSDSNKFRVFVEVLDCLRLCQRIICTIYLCGALHSFYTIFSFIIAKFDSFWGLIVKIIKIFLIFLHDLAFNCDDIYRGTKKTLSPWEPWKQNIRITGYIQLTLPQPKERFGRCVPVLTRGYRHNGGGAPPEAGEVAWNTYLKRRVSNHDTHRGDALKASAVLPTMWYRKWELFPAAGSVVRPRMSGE